MSQIRQFSLNFCEICPFLAYLYSDFEQNFTKSKKSKFLKLKTVKIQKLYENHENEIAKNFFSFLQNVAFLAKKKASNNYEKRIFEKFIKTKSGKKTKKVISYDPYFRLHYKIWPLEISKRRFSLFSKSEKKVFSRKSAFQNENFKFHENEKRQ